MKVLGEERGNEACSKRFSSSLAALDFNTKSTTEA